LICFEVTLEAGQTGTLYGSCREEVLDPHIFSNLSQVRDLSWAWMLSYNEERPHSSLGNIPPAEFKRRLTAENSSLDL
jgi:putative transposase